MFRRVLVTTAAALAAALILPPLWYAVFPVPVPDLPAPGRRVEVAPGVGVNVIEAGAGPPIVLVHGSPGTAYDWWPLMQELADRGHRVLAYDRVGYAHSDARTEPSLVDANANELLAFLAAEYLTAVTLVGWSYGGGTSIAAANKDVSRIARIVLVGSVGPGIEKRPAPPEWLMELFAGPVLSWIVRVPPALERIGDAVTDLAFEPEPVPDVFRETAAANFGAPHTVETVRNEGRDLDGRADIDPSALALPILVIQGDGDRLVPAAVGEELHRRAPSSTLWMIEGGGHMLPLTRPARVGERIATFASR